MHTVPVEQIFPRRTYLQNYDRITQLVDRSVELINTLEWFTRTRGIDHPFGITVLSTVTSRPTPTRIIVDAGRKAMSVDVALPRPKELVGVQSVSLSAEHGRIELAEPTDAIHVGDRLEWVVGYGDTTVCLHDEMVGVRDGVVETVWPILGRGKLT